MDYRAITEQRAEHLEVALKSAIDEASGKARELSKVVATLSKLTKEATLESPDKVREQLRLLHKMELGPLGLEVKLGEWIRMIKEDQKQRLEVRRNTLTHELISAAQSRGIACSVLTSHPLELSLTPLTVVVDFAANIAELKYARLSLEKVAATPDEIIKAHKKSVERLKSGFAPERFSDVLRETYRTVCQQRGVSYGDRVDLVALLAPLALALQPNRFLSDPVAAHYRSYGRVRFAWDLARLRQEGLLARGGHRLSLGSATGNTTKRKTDVLYIEDTMGKGQYYLTLWYTANNS